MQGVRVSLSGNPVFRRRSQFDLGGPFQQGPGFETCSLDRGCTQDF